MKFLLDTNIILEIEDNRQVDKTFASLTRKLSEHGVRVYIDPAVRDDVERDRDEARRAITLSKLAKFESLKSAGQTFVDRIIQQTSAPLRPNDESDIRLLAAIAANAADFLITEDLGLHRRARRADLSDRVLTVAEALKFVVRQFDATEVVLPFISEMKAYEIDRTATIFDTLREDYKEFDDWFEEKCAKEHRDCWVVVVGTEIAGILILKIEDQNNTDARSSGNKVLKICTFKMQPEYRGEKFGEQLLKKALWHAQTNRFDTIYLTVFDKQIALISLLERFGFRKTYTNARGEDVFEKSMIHSDIHVPNGADILELDRTIYPRVVDIPSVRKFLVPILPDYHKVLFPEIAYAKPLPLFGDHRREDLITSTGKSNRTPGNTIRKIYLCRSPNTNLRPGDIILFYQSKDDDFANSQCITTLGVVESIDEFSDADSLSTHVARRSVFSRDELDAMFQAKKTPVKAIDFLLIGHLDPPITLSELIASGAVRNRPPQSIAIISEAAYSVLKPVLKLRH